ncbi:transketolase, partial [Vibrio cholerae HC-80A1]|jgi:hypothetical protein
MLSA